MFEYIFLFIALVSLWIVLSFYIVPKRKHTHYINTLTKLGYKVKAIPFQPFAFSSISVFGQGIQRDHDPMGLYKREFVGYDVIVENIVRDICLTVLKPDLMKEVFTPDKLAIYHKDQRMIRATRAIFGKGMAFSENDIWKRKRKIISQVFSHQLLVDNIPNIAKICESAM